MGRGGASAIALFVLLSILSCQRVESVLSISLASNTSALVVFNDVPVAPFDPATALIRPFLVGVDERLDLVLHPNVSGGTVMYAFQFIPESASIVTGVTVGGDVLSSRGDFLDDSPLVPFSSCSIVL
jgi:hypothetical protein